jgi:hypothetical protein
VAAQAVAVLSGGAAASDVTLSTDEQTIRDVAELVANQFYN